jgi:hypothetical protein
MRFRSIPQAVPVLILLGPLATITLAQSNPLEKQKISLLRADNTTTALPLEAGTVKSKNKLAGMAGAKTFTEIPGKQAIVRLSVGQPQTFVLRLEGLGSDAYEAMTAGNPGYQFATLYKVDSNKKNNTREVVFADTTFYGVYAKTKGVGDFRGIPLNFSHYDAQDVRLETRTPLPPGEYAFVAVAAATDPYAAQNQTHFYCFGVD